MKGSDIFAFIFMDTTLVFFCNLKISKYRKAVLILITKKDIKKSTAIALVLSLVGGNIIFPVTKAEAKTPKLLGDITTIVDYDISGTDKDYFDAPTDSVISLDFDNGDASYKMSNIKNVSCDWSYKGETGSYNLPYRKDASINSIITNIAPATSSKSLWVKMLEKEDGDNPLLETYRKISYLPNEKGDYIKGDMIKVTSGDYILTADGYYQYVGDGKGDYKIGIDDSSFYYNYNKGSYRQNYFYVPITNDTERFSKVNGKYVKDDNGIYTKDIVSSYHYDEDDDCYVTSDDEKKISNEKYGVLSYKDKKMDTFRDCDDDTSYENTQLYMEVTDYKYVGEGCGNYSCSDYSQVKPGAGDYEEVVENDKSYGSFSIICDNEKVEAARIFSDIAKNAKLTININYDNGKKLSFPVNMVKNDSKHVSTSSVLKTNKAVILKLADSNTIDDKKFYEKDNAIFYDTDGSSYERKYYADINSKNNLILPFDHADKRGTVIKTKIGNKTVFNMSGIELEDNYTLANPDETEYKQEIYNYTKTTKDGEKIAGKVGGKYWLSLIDTLIPYYDSVYDIAINGRPVDTNMLCNLKRKVAFNSTVNSNKVCANYISDLKDILENGVEVSTGKKMSDILAVKKTIGLAQDTYYDLNTKEKLYARPGDDTKYISGKAPAAEGTFKNNVLTVSMGALSELDKGTVYNITPQVLSTTEETAYQEGDLIRSYIKKDGTSENDVTYSDYKFGELILASIPSKPLDLKYDKDKNIFSWDTPDDEGLGNDGKTDDVIFINKYYITITDSKGDKVFKTEVDEKTKNIKLPEGTIKPGETYTFHVSAENRLGEGEENTIQYTEATPIPTTTPTAAPTVTPTAAPTVTPTATPTVTPTATPTVIPTAVPTVEPTKEPLPVPTQVPTAAPTEIPTATPTTEPTEVPTEVPTEAPTKEPVVVTEVPTVMPTTVPEKEKKQTPVPTKKPVVKKNTAPKTGDKTNIFLWSTLFVLSTGCIIFVFFKRKRNK